jgi:hypothetical protein
VASRTAVSLCIKNGVGMMLELIGWVVVIFILLHLPPGYAIAMSIIILAARKR